MIFVMFLFGFIFADNIFDTTQEDFDEGEYNDTTSHSDGHVLLDVTGANYYSSGDYISRVFDLGASSNLSSLFFSSTINYKQNLPDNAAAEQDINMYGNVFLMHVDSDSIVADEAESYGLGLRGGITSTEGKFGNALVFDGSNDIAFTNNLIPGNEYTFSLWIKTNTNNKSIFTFSSETPSGSTYDRRLSIDSSNRLIYYVYPNTPITLTGSANTITNNSWHHVAIISKYNGTNYDINVYLDGELDSSRLGLTAGGYNSYTTPRLNIGHSVTYFSGAIDDFAFYDSALTLDEITAIYNSGDGLEFEVTDNLICGWRFDDAISNLSLTDTSPTPKTFVYPSVANNYLGVSYSPYNYYSLFSQNQTLSTDYYVKTSQFYPPTSAMTISFWLNTKSNSKSVLGWIGGPPNNSVFIESGYVKWYFSNAPTYFATTATVNDGAWHHIVFTRNANNSRKVYLDGVLNNSSNSAYTINNDYTTAVIMYLFHSAVYNGGFGIIDELAIFNRELALGEISNIYKRGVGELRLQVRACEESDCSDDPVFVGVDGEESYLDVANNIFDISNIFESGVRYLQYIAEFETLDTLVSKNTSPILLDVNIEYSQNISENSEPEILSLNVCKESCDIAKNILPGIDSFVIKAQISDADGEEDLNFESAIIKIYNSNYTEDSEDGWDHITLTNLVNYDDEGCITNDDYYCFLVYSDDLSQKFISGETNVFFSIKDNSNIDANYELEYLEDENGLFTSGIFMESILNLSIDSLEGSFSGDPGDEDVELFTDNELNYIIVQNNGNCDVNLFLVSENLINSEYELPITSFEWNLVNSPINNRLAEDGTLLINNWSRGTYPDDNSQNIYLWLDIPSVIPGDYTGTFTFELRN